jgi:phosphonate transport system substrate-binding protein
MAPQFPASAAGRRLPLLALACLAGLALLTGCGSSDTSSNSSSTGAASSAPKQVTLAVVPSESAAAIQAQFAPFIKYVSQQAGTQVKLIPSTSYAAVIEALRAGKADIALLGPLSYVIAKNQGVKLTAVGAQIPAKGFPATYRSYGVVKSGSDISSIDQAKGKKVCYADPGSTSGYLYPSQALKAAGIDPQNDVKAIFAGGPDKSAIAAAKGQCDIGFSFDAMVDVILPGAKAIKKGDLKVIWRSAKIPGSPVVLRDGLDAGTKAKLTKAILSANNDVYKQQGLCPASGDCGVGGTYGYAPAQDSSYDGVRQACEATKLEACNKP